MQISLVKNSFYFTYIFLITTGTICFIEALRNSDPRVRHIMNLETLQEMWNTDSKLDEDQHDNDSLAKLNPPNSNASIFSFSNLLL